MGLRELSFCSKYSGTESFIKYLLTHDWGMSPNLAAVSRATAVFGDSRSSGFTPHCCSGAGQDWVLNMLLFSDSAMG